MWLWLWLWCTLAAAPLRDAWRGLCVCSVARRPGRLAVLLPRLPTRLPTRSTAGTVVALHNGDGHVLWSVAFGAGAEPLRLALWRVPHDLTHEIEASLAPACLLLVSRIWGAGTSIASWNAAHAWHSARCRRAHASAPASEPRNCWLRHPAGHPPSRHPPRGTLILTLNLKRIPTEPLPRPLPALALPGGRLQARGRRPERHRPGGPLGACDLLCGRPGVRQRR